MDAFAGSLTMGSVVEPADLVRVLTYQPLLDPYNPLLFLLLITLGLAWLYSRSLDRKSSKADGGWALAAEMEKAITEHSLHTAELHRLQVELQRARQECERLNGMLVLARAAVPAARETASAAVQADPAPCDAATETDAAPAAVDQEVETEEDDRLRELAARLTSSEQELQRWQADVQRKAGELTEAQLKLAAAQASTEVAECGLRSRQSMLEVTMKHCEALQTEMAKCKTLLRMLPKQSTVVRLEMEVTTLKDSVAILQAGAAVKERQLKELRREKREAAQQLAALGRKVAASDERLQAAAKRRTDAEAEVQQSTQRYMELCRVVEQIAEARTQKKLDWSDDVNDEPLEPLALPEPVPAAESRSATSCSNNYTHNPYSAAEAPKEIQDVPLAVQPRLPAEPAPAQPPAVEQETATTPEPCVVAEAPAAQEAPSPAPAPRPEPDISRRYFSSARDPLMRSRFDLVFQSVIGRLCQVHLKDGTRYEGIFDSKAPNEFSIKLGQARLMVSPVHGPEMRTNPRTSVRLQACDIVFLACVDVDVAAAAGVPRADGADDC